MVAISLPTAGVVYLAAVHLGLALGWHVGNGIEAVRGAIADRKGLLAVVGSFLWRALQTYDFGIAITTVSLALLLGVTNWPVVGLLVALGFGVGLAYSDREDHPPEGMLAHVTKRIRKTDTGPIEPEP